MSEEEQQPEAVRESDEAIVTEIGKAVEGIFARNSIMATKWLILTEALDVEGNYGLWTFGGQDMRPWDVLGLLSYAKIIQEGELQHEDHDDD